MYRGRRGEVFLCRNESAQGKPFCVLTGSVREAFLCGREAAQGEGALPNTGHSSCFCFPELQSQEPGDGGIEVNVARQTDAHPERPRFALQPGRARRSPGLQAEAGEV